MIQHTKEIDDAFELADVPIVDAHCHPMRPLGEPLSVTTFERQMSLIFMEHNWPEHACRSLVREWPTHTLPRPTIMLNYLYRHLGDFLGVPPEPERVLAAREERAQDYAGYLQALLDDAGVEQLIVDTGYPGDIQLHDFGALAGLPLSEIVRIDQVMAQVAEESEGFRRFVEVYCTRLEESLRDSKCVGLKSIIAYLTGLDIGPQDPAEAAKQFPAFRQEPYCRDFKALRDYCFYLALERCMEFNKPLQIHSGFGDDDIVFTRCAPQYLHELLAFPPYSDCLVVLVHGGHPWSAEAAVMASLLPNVYLDISETCPFFSYGVAEMLWEVLQVAPLNKVMYGSDAIHVPELFWLGAKLGRYAVGNVLANLTSAGFSTPAEGRIIGRHILHDNAVALYRLAS